MPANAATRGENSSISDAVRLRLRALVRSLGDSSGDESSEQMLMDVDLDGQRYLLIRMPAAAPQGVSLSPREVEIVRLVAAGHQNKVIASVLEISSWTVCTHMRRVFAKFGVTSRAAMVARVAALGGIVDGMPLPRARPQESDDPIPYRSAVRHAARNGGTGPVAALALQHRNGGLAATKNGAARTAAAPQGIR